LADLETCFRTPRLTEILGNKDLAAIDRALDRAMAATDRPSLIKLTSSIGYGSLLQDTAACHGSPLKQEDIKQFKHRFNLAQEPFNVPNRSATAKCGCEGYKDRD
jgi:transketolase